MTNKKFHRRARALDRLEARGELSLARRLEAQRLLRIVTQYRAGGPRAKNGRGAGLHPSNAAA